MPAPKDDLAKETAKAVDQLSTNDRMAKAIENLTDMLKGGMRRSRKDILEDEPAKPDADELEDEYEESEQDAANREVTEARFKGGAHEPRDEEDERAQREAARVQARQFHGKKKSRHEDEDEEEYEKSRREDEDEDEREEKSRARKAKHTSHDFWDDDEDAVHGYEDDPAVDKAEGAEDADDDTIITNMGRRIKRREGKKSLREAFAHDLSKSRGLADVIEVSDEMNELTTIVANHLGTVEKSLGRFARTERLVGAMAETMLELAKSQNELRELLGAQPARTPATGVVLPADGVRKGGAPRASMKEVRDKLIKGSQRGIVDSHVLAAFDSLAGDPLAGNMTLEDFISRNLTDEQRAALSL